MPFILILIGMFLLPNHTWSGILSIGIGFTWAMGKEVKERREENESRFNKK